MEVYVSEEDKKQFKTYGNDTVYELKVVDNLTWSFNSNMVDLQSLEQHDKELRLKIYKEAYEQGKFDVTTSLEYKQGLEQHEQEIRKQERQKVIAELEEWLESAEIRTTEKETWDALQELKQKLNEMKGETK